MNTSFLECMQIFHITKFYGSPLKIILYSMLITFLWLLTFAPFLAVFDTLNPHSVWQVSFALWNVSCTYDNTENEEMIVAVNQFIQLHKEAWKKFRTSTGFEPVTLLHRCDALPTELWNHWRWEQVNCGFICFRERNEC